MLPNFFLLLESIKGDGFLPRIRLSAYRGINACGHAIELCVQR